MEEISLGYPERISFRDFRRRFSCLAGSAVNRLDALDDRAAAERILANCDIHQHRYRLGISQLLLASDLLVELEDKRELSLSGLIESLQRICRRHLATKWLQKRRMLESAIRCIQVSLIHVQKKRNLEKRYLLYEDKNLALVEALHTSCSPH